MSDTITLNAEDASLVASLIRVVDPDMLDSAAHERLRQIEAEIKETQQTRMVTAICKEVGYGTDPLIYAVEITGRVTEEKVTEAVRDARRYDLDEDCEDEIQSLIPLFVFEGDLRTIADWRD